MKMENKSVNQNFQLPPLPKTLAEKIEKLGAAKCQSSMIAFYGDHLTELTDSAPTPSDYFNYAQAIVSAFPALAGGQHNNGIIRSALSIRIRNQRCANKRKSMGLVGAANNHKTNALGVVHGEDQLKPTTSVDDEEAKRELKRCREMDDCAHVRNLLKATHDKRRLWIENEAENITQIIDSVPHLKQASLLLYEFLLLRKCHDDLDGLKKKVRDLLQKTHQVAELTGDSEDDEKDIRVLVWLFGQLCQKRFLSGGVRELFILKQVFSSLDDLDSASTNSPRLVFYLSEGKVCTAFIVADGSLKLKLEDLSVESAVLCLLAAYYVFDCAYPTAYRATLCYLDYEILGTPMPDKQPTTAKFLRMMKPKCSTD